MEKCTKILKKNIGVSWKDCDVNVCVCGNRGNDKPNPASKGEKCILVIKPGSENRGIVVLYYIGKTAQHKSIFFIYKEL